MRVLTNELDKELTKLLKNQQISKVDIATAWATEGNALDALEQHKKRRKGKLTVRSMAGFTGNHTTPGALKRLAKLGEVRLVDGDTGMFHVKLFLFAGPRGSFAWVGSANFTKRGFESNEELFFEIKVTGKLQEWFDLRWKEIGAQPDKLAAYCKGWQKPDPMRLEVPEADAVRNIVDDGAKEQEQPSDGKLIVFVQEGKRPPPDVEGGNGKRFPPHGKVEIGNSAYGYTSAQECLKVVLEALQQRDSSFLRRCSTDDRFHKRGKSRYIARTKPGLGSEAFRKWAWRMRNGWWLSNKTQTREKWKLIEAAADVAKLRLEVRGGMWKAERSAKDDDEVGF